MKKAIFLFTLIGILQLFVLVSCKSSSQSPSSGVANTPNPTERSMVETAQVLLRQTEQIVNASPTPIPTKTHTPTPQISITETSLIFREDQTAEFIDHRAGIKLTIPTGWLPVRPNEDEFYKAFTLDVVQENQEIVDRLAHIQSSDTNFVRLDVIDIRDGHIQDGILTVINVIFEEDDTRTLEKWVEAERKKKQPFENFKFISSSYPETANGTRILVIEESWASGKSNTIYYRGVFFSLPTGTIVLDFYTSDKFKETVLPDFEEVVNSLVELGQ